jgi:hypothetical protein
MAGAWVTLEDPTAAAVAFPVGEAPEPSFRKKTTETAMTMPTPQIKPSLASFGIFRPP